jgi:hypothetical protein
MFPCFRMTATQTEVDEWGDKHYNTDVSPLQFVPCPLCREFADVGVTPATLRKRRTAICRTRRYHYTPVALLPQYVG